MGIVPTKFSKKVPSLPVLCLHLVLLIASLNEGVAVTWINLLRIQLKLNTALLSTVRVFVTGVTSHISRIYKGINAMLIIRGPIKPYIF